MAYANDLNQLFSLGDESESAQAKFRKAVILAQQDEGAEALKIFSELTQKHPEWPEPFNNMAVIYMQKGQYDKARMVLEAALKTHASYTTAHGNLSALYAKMASDAYDKALQVDHKKVAPTPKFVLLKEIVSAGTVRVVAKPTSLPTPAPVVVAAAKPKEPKPQVKVPAPAPPSPVPLAPVVAPKPVAAAPLNQDQQKAVMDVVQGWANAWSAKNVPAYLA